MLEAINSLGVGYEALINVCLAKDRQSPKNNNYMLETNIVKPLYHNDYADLNLPQLRSSFIEIKFLKMLLNGTTALLFN